MNVFSLKRRRKDRAFLLVFDYFISIFFSKPSVVRSWWNFNSTELKLYQNTFVTLGRRLFSLGFRRKLYYTARPTLNSGHSKSLMFSYDLFCFFINVSRTSATQLFVLSCCVVYIVRVEQHTRYLWRGRIVFPRTSARFSFHEPEHCCSNGCGQSCQKQTTMITFTRYEYNRFSVWKCVANAVK